MVKLPTVRWLNSRALMYQYNMVTIVNKCIVYLKVAMELDPKCSHYRQKKVTTWSNECINLWYHFAIYTCIKSSGCTP